MTVIIVVYYSLQDVVVMPNQPSGSTYFDNGPICSEYLNGKTTLQHLQIIHIISGLKKCMPFSEAHHMELMRLAVENFDVCFDGVGTMQMIIVTVIRSKI
jgi:hypothetical protein